MNIKLTTMFVAAALTAGVSFAQKNIDKELQETKKFQDKEKAAATKESMRDKTHDGVRTKTGKDSSVGLDEKGANWKKTTK